MHGPDGELPSVSLWIAIAIILLCLGLSAFFAASETALTAASRARMHALEKQGDGRAALVNRLLRAATADRRVPARQHARQYRRLGLHDQHSRGAASGRGRDLCDRPHDRSGARLRRSYAEDRGDQLS